MAEEGGPVHDDEMFLEGDRVRVVEGPFEGFYGVADRLDFEKQRIRVQVECFGRNTPVEFDFSQINKIS